MDIGNIPTSLDEREINQIIERARVEKILGAINGSLKIWGLGLYCAFSVVDYIYRPDLWLQWGLLRVFVVIAFISVTEVINKLLRIDYYNYVSFSLNLALLNVLVPANVINIMIYQTGGLQSLYVPGVFFVTSICATHMRLGRLQIFVTAGISHSITTAIFLVTYSEVRPLLIAVAFQVGYLVLLVYFGETENSYNSKLAKAISEKNIEIENHRKTEFLKSYFPRRVKEKYEKMNIDLPKSKLIKNAIIGFFDLTNSTEMGVALTHDQDTEFRNKFYDGMCELAEKFGFIIIAFLGDAILFLANYDEEDNSWKDNLVPFYESSILFVDDLVSEYSSSLEGIDIRLKGGIGLMGESTVGLVGTKQVSFSATGNVVSFASRLTDCSKGDELTLTQELLDLLRSADHEFIPGKVELQGFKNKVFEIAKANCRTSGGPLCPVCKKHLFIFKDRNGLSKIECLYSHETT